VILARAIDVASSLGLEGITFGGLADDLRLSKGNLTVLFGDKERLQLATLDAAVQRFIEVIVSPALRKRTPLARLRALCEGWFAYMEGMTFPGGCFIYAAAHEYRARPGVIRNRVIAMLNAWKRQLGAEIRDARRDGQIRAEVKTRETVSVLCGHQNAAHLAQLLDDRASFDLARRLSREHIASLLPRS